MNQAERKGFWSSRAGLWLASLLLLVALAGWLWPYGFGGRMPVGGDVTQFFLGLMAFYQSEIRAGRLPVWNDLWGFGFPGLAESQMGVYYPPHWLLYRFLSLELAYTLSMVLHTFWAGLGAAWAARRFGASTWASMLAGFSWAASGFFLIHLPHQWAYTVGSWMPWAVGLGWVWLSGQGCWRTPWMLALVLAIQVLPGHFQLAFETQVALCCIGLWSLVERPGGWRAALGRLGVLLLALAAVLPLDAMQLWPTWKLAQLSERRGDFEYLSGFAATPIHLVSYVAPGLFHFSPLWRPVAWDVFHTSPEEHMGYVGLVPLFLACGALRYGIRSECTVRALLVLGLVSLYLSLGPYVPGFEELIHLPGFSWFRAPARWGLVTELALCLLAARGFDRLASWPKPLLSITRFLVVSLLAPLALVLMFETLLVAGVPGNSWDTAKYTLNQALHYTPWGWRIWDRENNDVESLTTKSLVAQGGQEIESRLLRQGFRLRPRGGYRLAGDRLEIYVHELGPMLLIMGLMLVAALLSKRPSQLAVVLMAITLVDLESLGGHRTIDDAPLRSLVGQSTLLTRLASQPRGQRVLYMSTAANWPMLAGAESLHSYRTLTIPAGEGLLLETRWPLSLKQPATKSHRQAIGLDLIIENFQEQLVLADLARRTRTTEMSPGEIVEFLDDPSLAGWLFGVAWIKVSSEPDARTFLLRRDPDRRSAVWFVPGVDGPPFRPTETMNGHIALDKVFQDSTRTRFPLKLRRASPVRFDVDLEAPQPGSVIISQLQYPGWQAWWTRGKENQPAEVERVFENWQAVRVPEPGTWTLHLQYRAPDAWQGLAVSTIAWPLGLIGFISHWRIAKNRRRAIKHAIADQRTDPNDERGDHRSLGIHSAGAGDSPAAAPGCEDHSGDVAAG